MMRFSALCVVASLCTGLMTQSALADDFTWAAYGGTLQEAQRQVYLPEFKKAYKGPVAEDIHPAGSWAKFDAMAQTGKTDWDLVDVESHDVYRGCQEGIFEKIDYKKLGFAKSDFIDGAALDCGVGAYVYSVALVYNTQRVTDQLTSTKEFWDVKKYPGMRALQKGPRYNMEFALLSDGVPAQNVYKMLATHAGVERAFKKLDAIKSNIVWWNGPSTVPALVASGSAVMAIAPLGRMVAARNAGQPLGLVFVPGLIGMDYWAIPKGTAYRDQSYALLKTFEDPQLQAAFTKTFPYSPTSKKAIALLDPKEAADLPVGDNAKGSLLMATQEANSFWMDNGDALNEQWNNWLAR